jgi:ferric-dicitrate binding protein FerR (iron transport regulator)
MLAHPEQLALVNEAKDYMNNLVIDEPVIPAERVLKAERQLVMALTNTAQEAAPKVIPMKRSARWWWAAAAIVILAVSGTLLWNRSQPPASIQTAYGEIREQRLPDGSRVMLNAHSEITYESGWEKGVEREVWLKGEAFFHVAKTPAKSRFVVHTEKCDIIVTGTQFNVVNRPDKTSIMLTEGSVILHAKDGTETRMQPGDFVEFNNEKSEKKIGKEESILAWRDRRLFFDDNTPLSVAIKKIEEHYGVKIRLSKPSLGDKPITGMMPNDNLDVILQALEATSEFHVTRTNDEIVISD